MAKPVPVVFYPETEKLELTLETIENSLGCLKEEITRLKDSLKEIRQTSDISNNQIK